MFEYKRILLEEYETEDVETEDDVVHEVTSHIDHYNKDHMNSLGEENWRLSKIYTDLQDDKIYAIFERVPDAYAEDEEPDDEEENSPTF